MNTKVKVIVTNTYVFNRRLIEYKQLIIDNPVHAIMAQECQKLGALKGYRRIAAPVFMHDKAEEVAVYLRSDLPVDGIIILRLTDDVGNKFAHDRWIVVVLTVIDNKRFAFISVHANAQATNASSANARENRKLHRKLLQVVRGLRRSGLEVVTGGDWNRGRKAKGWGTPSDLARKLGMKVKLNVIDGILFSKNATLSKWEVKDAPGSNHKLVYCTLTYKWEK